ncbi:hypothetical protein H5410_022542, partial [Solanum commersonii]
LIRLNGALIGPNISQCTLSGGREPLHRHILNLLTQRSISHSTTPSPLLVFASSDPFTPSPSPPSLETPNPNSALFPSTPPIETHIPTTTTTIHSPSPTPFQEQDLDDVPLSTSLWPFTRSTGQAQLKESMESITKHCRVSKSPVQPSSCPVMLDFESEEVSASLYHLPLPHHKN